jgi:peptidoglycan hydrolase-like protein with peptidoglycan-binding domain
MIFVRAGERSEIKLPSMKRGIVYFLVALFVLSSVRADQTTQLVQQALKDQGFYYGNVTGNKSAETTAAIRRYQIRNGLQVTGEINSETLRSLNVNSNSAASSQQTSKPAVTQSNTARPNQSARVEQNPAPQSPSAPDRQLETNPAFSGAPYQSIPPRIPPRMNSRMIAAEVQRQLMSRGYYQGRIDGRYGRRTAFAMRAFQFQSGLPPTGRLDTSTLDALGISGESLASLGPAPRAYETWVPITKFKHGKWKVKWKRLHRGDRDEHGDDDRAQNADAWWRGEDHDD